MSQENIELVRDAYAAFNRGDFVELDADGLIARAQMFRPAQEADALDAPGLRE